VDRVLSAGAPFLADEPARHKLLDLVGDLYLYGGPPRGRVRATRPGHGATHEAMRRALAEGLVAREGP
jgi:UDP-3-O-[3-hydroxymyristoyl] N-acetylglucosamine deacetylase